MITHIKGDLFAANERAIAHGCNCHGVMGAGVARIVAQMFPWVFTTYKQAVDLRQFYPGVAQPVVCYSEILDGRKVNRPVQESTTVYNLATQNAPGANAKIDYVMGSLLNMKRHMDFVGNERIAMPKIGAGIGGLNWAITEQIIIDVFSLDRVSPYTVVVYSL